ncbi:MAG TPA: hypothetical protein VK154_14300 [Chitinophagales bacterium]|nr:hypothetical protein [Chitinophagales bacterium]
MNIHRILLMHAIMTCAAGLMLVIKPSVIPDTVDVHVRENQYLLCYLLAAAQFAIAYLSFSSRKITDFVILKHILVTLIIFHASTMVLEIISITNGVSLTLLGNIIARAVIVSLLSYFGLYKGSKERVLV